jgi:ubiquitin carboxyl-terminal hydrolase 8
MVASYAAAAAGVRPTQGSTLNPMAPPPFWSSSQHQQHRVRQLMDPPPTSMTLMAAVQLLQGSSAGSVFLMEIAYVQNWFVWALHQPVPSFEKSRASEALRLAALELGLIPPAPTMEYHDPGPIDSTALSVEGHPLLLSPLAEVRRPNGAPVSSVNAKLASMTLQRVRSFTDITNSGSNYSLTMDPVGCLAVPEVFYETLRATHGVICDDGYSVSFQPLESERLLLHHNIFRQTQESTTRPIEFRRKIIHRPVHVDTSKTPTSLMDKLLREEQQVHEPKMEAAVEVHPVKLLYRAEDESSSTAPVQGFVLVSRDTVIADALAALLRAVAPDKTTECVRVWSRRDYPVRNESTKKKTATALGDGFELFDYATLVSTRSSRTDNHQLSRMTVAEWVKRHHTDESIQNVDLLIETRRSVNAPWPRAGLELSERLQVGDYVDAQDVAGNWYEAVVREVKADTVTVHYIGWSSRWDARLRRRRQTKDLEGVNQKVEVPTPLWSNTRRWREHICVGDIIEVRDSSSLVHRPKWYKGEVKKVGRFNDPVRDTTGGASLEQYAVTGAPNEHEPLVLFHRIQQVLVEVEQERTEKLNVPLATSPGEGDLAAGGLNPQPPFLRWVNLFGEEICELGTHLKTEDARAPFVVTYDYDTNRKPVEVLKSLHPSLGAGFIRESLRGVPPAPGSVGLHNLGNSCFLNATIQCLNHIEPLTQYFLQGKYLDELNRNNPLGSGGNVAMSYASLLKKMWGGEYSTLVPRLLKQTVASFAPQFDNCYQHDSQEFGQFLMDGLHEDLNRVQTKPYVEELEGLGMPDDQAAIESWRKHLLRHDSIIVDHCQGMHRSHLTCPRCGRESIKFDIFSSISVPLACTKQKSAIQLQDCLEKFMEGEQLDERNAWYCPKCRQHVCALKMIALWTIPDILIIHLKRFTFDTCMASGHMLRSKVDDKVEFPIEGLDLTKYILGPVDPDAPPVYRLFGVSEHTGPTANSGHYTATVRNSIDGQWYRCNDSHVGRTSGEASITGGAYVLFYQRSKGISKWGGMSRAMAERKLDPFSRLEKDKEGFTKVKMKKKKSK